MKTLHNLGPSPEHEQYRALLPQFWERVDEQERQLVALGLPMTGLARFGRDWFNGWATQSVSALADCMAEECDFIDSTTFQNIRIGKQETLANCAACFEAFPDMAFYPQDDSLRSLPYTDFSHGRLRMVIPWRGIARWTGPQRLPGTDIVLPPTGRCLNFIGVDRYVLTDDFKISHIDTDWDMMFMGIQLSPINIRSPRLGTMKAASLAARAVMPLLRLIGSGGTEEHRRFDLPIPGIALLEQGSAGAPRTGAVTRNGVSA